MVVMIGTLNNIHGAKRNKGQVGIAMKLNFIPRHYRK